MKITFLGTGTSNGVPAMGCDCEVCRSEDPCDRRLRSSLLVETERTRILIDCGPDFRQQMLSQPFRAIDAVLVTHEHYDHVGGMDDLRPFCRFGEIPLYMLERTATQVKSMLPYCFGENDYPGIPKLTLHSIVPHQPFYINELEIVPFEVMHAQLPILGFRIGTMAYITDMKTMQPEEMDYLKGVDILIINGLRHTYHHSHQTIAEACDVARQMGVKQTFLIHLSHGAGLHRCQHDILPEGVAFAYDGLTLYC